MHDIPLSLPPLSLYVHIPWCIRKCPYCDFNSHTSDGHLPEDQYVQALIRELEIELPYAQGRNLSSIFFGGGTPSLFSAESIGRVVQAARRRFGFNDTIEITLEANPGTFEQTKFNGFRDVGVNRLSIGIQSFNDRHLTRLGRIHSAENAHAAVAMAQSAGFDNINLDLMHGLPTQTEAEAGIIGSLAIIWVLVPGRTARLHCPMSSALPARQKHATRGIIWPGEIHLLPAVKTFPKMNWHWNS